MRKVPGHCVPKSKIQPCPLIFEVGLDYDVEFFLDINER